MKIRRTLILSIFLFCAGIVISYQKNTLAKEPIPTIKNKLIESRTKMICCLMGEGKTETLKGETWEGDLGITFTHNNQLYILTGDTGGDDNFAPNAIGFTKDRKASNCLNFNWVTRPNGGPRKFFPLIKPESTVPSGAISVNGIIYVFMMDVTNWAPPATAYSILAKSEDNGKTFESVWKREIDDKFVNIAPIISVHPLVPSKKALFLIGSGKYRNSPIYLAVTELDNVEKKDSYLYFSGMRDGAPFWSKDENAAAPVIDEVNVGELSVQWNDYLKQWLLAYFDYSPQRSNMYFRSATNPWGPWSEPKLVFMERIQYDWYGYRMTKFGTKKSWGTPYGGYLLPNEYNGENGRVVYFVLSLWTPYTIFLMEADLGNIF